MLSKNTKFIIGAIIVTLILGVVIYFIIKKYRQNITRNIKVDESNLSYDKSQYDLWASQLFSAMEGGGTNEDSVYRVLLNIKNQDDWNQLVKAFGVKEDGSWYISFSGTLVDWFNSEFNTTDYNKCIEILQKVGVSI